MFERLLADWLDEPLSKFGEDPGLVTASTRNHWSAKHGLRRFWWTSLFVQTNGLAVSL